ncbi:hypothetical protein [Mesorhizobium australicum]
MAIGGEIYGIILLRENKFDQGHLPLIIGSATALSGRPTTWIVT